MRSGAAIERGAIVAHFRGAGRCTTRSGGVQATGFYRARVGFQIDTPELSSAKIVTSLA